MPGDLGGGRILSVIRGRAASLLGGRSGTEEVWDKGLVLAIVVGLGTVCGLGLVLGKVCDPGLGGTAFRAKSTSSRALVAAAAAVCCCGDIGERGGGLIFSGMGGGVGENGRVRVGFRCGS